MEQNTDELPKTKTDDKATYDCLDCLGFCCCQYERVDVSNKDIKRLSKHFNMPVETFKQAFTEDHKKAIFGSGKILKKKDDPILGEACIFFDTTERRCTVYKVRPVICGEYPHPDMQVTENRCHYFDIYKQIQKEYGKKHFPLIQIQRVVRK